MPIEPVIEAIPSVMSAMPAAESVLGQGLKFKGTITGTDTLYVDGTLDGSINIPTQRVTIGQNGHVLGSMTTTLNPCITAREIVVMGKITGNIVAADRVEIRAEGIVLGDVVTHRISIADGAFFRGEVDLRKPEALREAVVEPAAEGLNAISSLKEALEKPEDSISAGVVKAHRSEAEAESFTEAKTELDTIESGVGDV